MFKKILIANRGEIACRIHKTCQKLGVETATIHSSIDCNSRHVKLIGESIEVGGATSAESYLNIDAIIDAAKRLKVDAVHPGIGFLSEEPEFVKAVEAAGLVFIGPTADSIARFAD
ncbi:MAG: 3-methylcrotonyl-CoA carboxylase, partial [Pseudomonadales bacterium]|nr:3-methylcrotonyl-CoA carboxylase [Pseudomonadales bacterium]